MRKVYQKPEVIQEMIRFSGCILADSGGAKEDAGVSSNLPGFGGGGNAPKRNVF